MIEEKKVNINHTNKNGGNCLSMAMYNGNNEVIKYPGTKQRNNILNISLKKYLS